MGLLPLRLRADRVGLDADLTILVHLASALTRARELSPLRAYVLGKIREALNGGMGPLANEDWPPAVANPSQNPCRPRPGVPEERTQ